MEEGLVKKMKTQPEKIVIFAFDIETQGKSPSKHGIISCGIVVGTLDGTILTKIRFDVAPLEGQQMEERCMNEFWSKHSDILATLTKNQMWAMDFAHKFRQLLDSYDEDFTVYLLCDNPAFDAKYIDYYLDLYGLDSMQYKADGKTYRSVHDSDSYARGYLKYKFDRPWISNSDMGVEVPEIEAHYPENDAERIYRIHLSLVNK